MSISAMKQALEALENTYAYLPRRWGGEREACAKVCDLVARKIDDTNGIATYAAKAIRKRGER
jgi:hypothetical protein